MDTAPFALLGETSALACALLTKEDGGVRGEAMMEAFGAASLAGLHQVHGGKTVVVHGPVDRTIQADALVTDLPNLLLEIRAADCQTFLVYAPRQNVVGLIHAGWKGLLAGVIPSFFDVLWDEWQIQPEDTIVCAGPSLCTACAEFTDPKRELPGIRSEFFEGRNVNLRAVAEDQLWRLGVREDRFERHPDCTRCHNDLYWSYRGTDRAAVMEGTTNVLVAMLRQGV